jgi:murein DD-endopeptidase MepM/ murein hydrolase activator NlpD
MTARFLRVLTVGAAIAGLGLGSAAARSLAEDASQLRLTPLVWRADDGQARLIAVARHRRHHLRPEVGADDAPAKRGRHGKAKAAKTVTVGKGDTINAIARRLGTTPAAIMRANPDVSPRRMHAGEVLNVPTAAEEAGPSESEQPTARESSRRERHGRETAREKRAAEESEAKPRTYTVKHGDTLYRIGQRFDVPLDELRRLNGLGRSSSLHSGQVIKLEGRPPAPPPERPARTERPAPVRRHGQLPPSGEVPGRAPSPAPSFTAPSSVPPPQPVPSNAAAGAPAAPIPYTQLPGHVPPPVTAPPARTPPSTYTPPAYPPPTASALPPARTPPATYAPPSYAPPPASPGVTGVPSAPAVTDAQVAAAGRGRFIWPTRGNVISGFGPKPGGQQNDGVDIAAPAGASVSAAAAGDVVYAGNLVPGFGNLVLIKHQDGWVTAYAHLGTTNVKIKDHVTQGMTIGTVGMSGGVDQPQLHFEVRYATSPRERARPIDPALVLPVGQ